MFVNSDNLSAQWENVIEELMESEAVVVEQNNVPVAAIIAYADFIALQAQLEDLSDVRLAKAALAEYHRDPSSALPIEELIAKWAANDADAAVSSDDDALS